MSAPVRNAELLQRVMHHIDLHPERHAQSEWIEVTDCGTAACFAGWAAILTFGDDLVIDEQMGIFHCPAPYDDMMMSDAAQSLLGITSGEGDVLFTAWNTPEALHLMVDDLANGRVMRSAEEYATQANEVAAL